MKLFTCRKDGVVSELTECPVCSGKMIPFEKKLAKKAKRFPRIETPERKAQKEEQKRVSQIIENTCETFQCPGDIIGVRQGPCITEYKFRPMRHTRVKNITSGSMREDLAVVIPAENVSVARALGEKAINICVPNSVRQDIDFESTLANVLEHRYDMELPINLGVTSVGDPVVIDLTKAGPHMLIAGSTGSGKSVAINAILTSLLCIRSPKELELLLIDPKQVELMPYAGLPHVRRPPESSIMGSLALMDTVIQEMRRRMAFLAMMRVKNLKELNEKLKTMGEQTHPYWLLVIDEMAELAITEKKLFTERMASISSMARAAGIHIIAATQRPSVDVLSGKIKVNFLTRLGLKVPSVGDSRTVFGRSGAEQLLGKGDSFLMSGSTQGLLRCHLPFCTENHIRAMLRLSSDLGHVNNVPADGMKDGKFPVVKEEKPVETLPPQQKAQTDAEEQAKEGQPGYLLNTFLREKGTTLEAVRKLSREEQLVMNEDFKAWQHRRREQRRTV